MSDVRCRACGASMPASAQWCTLCFAAQGEPAGVRQPVSVPAAAPQLDAEVAPLPAPGPRHGASTEPTGARPAVAATLPPAAPLTARHAAPPTGETTWPCPRCGEAVAISLDACTSCGAGFLSGASAGVTTKIPVLGDFGSMSASQRWLTAAGLALGLIVVFTVLAFLVGKIF